MNIIIYMFKVKLLADVFNICWNKCLKIYKLDPARFFSITVLAWQAALKRGSSKIRYINWYLYFLIVRKGIRGGICHAIHRYVKTKKK